MSEKFFVTLIKCVWLVVNVVFLGTGVPTLVMYFDDAQRTGECGELWAYVMTQSVASLIICVVAAMSFKPRTKTYKQMMFSFQFLLTFGFVIWGGRIQDKGICESSQYMWSYHNATFWICVASFIIWIVGLITVGCTMLCDLPCKRDIKTYFTKNDEGYGVANDDDDENKSCCCVSWRRQRQARNQAQDLQAQIEKAVLKAQTQMMANLPQMMANMQRMQNNV